MGKIDLQTCYMSYRIGSYIQEVRISLILIINAAGFYETSTQFFTYLLVGKDLNLMRE